MASSTRLIGGVSLALGADAPGVAVHLRNVREAGLITRNGRGRNAAQMTPSDAAILLIAVTCSRHVKDSVATVSHFSTQAAALARDIEKAIAGEPIRDRYEFDLPSAGDAFYRVGFTSRTVRAVAELLAK